MDAPTEQLISTVAAAVAAVAVIVALVVAIIALVIAGKTLREARSTTEAQRETLRATEAVVQSTRTLVSRVEASTRILHLTFQEAEAARELEQLRRVAEQVAAATAARRQIREATAQHNPPHWFELQDALNLLAAHLQGFPPDALPKVRVLAEPDPRLMDPAGDQQAAIEIQQAIAAARVRLAEVAADRDAEATEPRD